MALLQAARFYALTGDLEKAKSFGLNRAIFYAWLKHHKPIRRPIQLQHAHQQREVGSAEGQTALPVKDGVEVSGKYFSIGGEIQRPEDFDRLVAAKFEALAPFEIVWSLAVRYVKSFGEEVLRDPNKFFNEVYLPVRDTFIDSLHRLLDVSRRDRKVEERPRRSSNVKPPIRRLTEFVRAEDKALDQLQG